MSEPHDTDDYLFDKSGVPDPEIQRLETLLAPFAHDGRGFLGADSRGVGRQRRRRMQMVGAALLIVSALITGAVIYGLGDRPLKLHCAQNQTLVRLGDKLTPREQIVLELEGGLSKITVDAGSVLYIDRLDEERTHLRLERGGLHAFVAAEAKERFFQVQTPATNCVDLGCMYTLTVDAAQTARVTVELGRVAFEDANRVVVVPADATCQATRQNGAGTPRHLDTPAMIITALDRYDAAPGEAGAAVRLRMVRRILAVLTGARDSRYSLIPWHLLQDPSPVISSAAGVWLMENRAGQVPAGFTAVPGRAVSSADRQAWRNTLEGEWGF